MAEEKIVKKVGVMSYAKISLIVSAIIGLIIGIFDAIISTVMVASGYPANSLFSVISYGVIIAYPIAYAILGFVGGIIGGFLYNMAAKWVGGVKLVFE